MKRSTSKFFCFSLLTSLSLMTSSCSDGSDPDTVQRDSLSPPLNLLTVTGDSSVELRWNAQNFEDELQGYHVYQISGSSVAEVAANTAALPQFPADDYTAEKLMEASVPRCAENNDFFALFGITQGSDEDCEGGLFLQDESADDSEEESGGTPLSAKIDCYDPAAPDTLLSNENISLPASADSDYRDGEGVQRCLVKNLTNGTNYTFMVVAVLGSDFDEISWTSNLTSDTPAPEVLNADLTIAGPKENASPVVNANYVSVDIDVANGFATSFSEAQTCNTNTGCVVTDPNNIADSKHRIFLARNNTPSFKQRLLISTSSDSTSNIRLIGRGPMTLDPVLGNDTISARVPGDTATEGATNYYESGRVVAIYENQVYDFVLQTDAGNSHYGKLITGPFNYADPTNSESDLTVNIRVVLQTAVDNTNYFTDF